MKKVLIVFLIIIALPLYMYNAFLLFKCGSPGKNMNGSIAKAGEKHTIERLLCAATPGKFEIKGRDPFTLYKERQPAPVMAQKPPVLSRKAEAKPQEPPPPVTLCGIMWNPEHPVAMLKFPGGATKLVSVGQALDNKITVKRIGKKNVTIEFDGKEFVVEKM